MVHGNTTQFSSNLLHILKRKFVIKNQKFSIFALTMKTSLPCGCKFIISVLMSKTISDTECIPDDFPFKLLGPPPFTDTGQTEDVVTVGHDAEPLLRRRLLL